MPRVCPILNEANNTRFKIKQLEELQQLVALQQLVDTFLGLLCSLHVNFLPENLRGKYRGV